MNEKKLQNKIIQYLKKEGWIAFKLVATLNGYPDVHAIKEIKGRATPLYIEVKGENLKPLEGGLQLLRIKQLKDQRAIAFWTNDFDDFLEQLQKEINKLL